MATTVLDLQAVLGLDMSGFESGLSKAKGIASGVGSGISSALKAGVAAVTAATTAVVGFGAASVKTGATFDKSMAQVAATMGKTMDDMENEVGRTTVTLNGEVKQFDGTLREFAQFMGQNTAFSASQAADALNYMALAGYKTQESMEMLPNVLNLAAAGNFDLARASDMGTDTQTAFGISFERTNQLVDEMAKAASTGNTSVEQLGDAFLVVGGLARELNGGLVTLKDGTTKSVDGIQEMEIAMTAMANAGVKGSEAGTHMRNMILKLSNPTDKGTKALERMGLKIYDTSGNMRSLVDIFGDLNTQLGTMTQEQKIQTISALFNTRDLASAEALLNAVGQDWNKIGESILDAKDAASEMAATQLDNLAGDVTLFKSALEGAQIAISDVLTPSLREFVQFGTKGLSELTEAFQKDGLSGAMSKFGELLSEGLDMVVKMLPDFVDAGIQLLGALGQGIIDNLDTLTGAASEIITMLSSSLLEGLPDFLSTGSEIISDLLQAIIDNLPTITPLIVEFIKGMAQLIVDNIDQFIDVAIEIAGAIGEGLIEAAPILAEKVPDVINKLIEAFQEHPEALVVLGPMFMDSLIGGITGSFGLLKGAFKGIGKFIDGGQIAGEVFKEIGSGMKSGVGNLAPHISSVAGSVGQFMTADIGTTMAAGGASAVATAGTAIVGSIAAFFGGAEIGKKIGGWLFPDDKDLYDSYSGISGTFEMLGDTVTTFGERTAEHWGEFKDSLSGGWDTVKENVSGAWDMIKSDTSEKWEGIKTSVSGAIDGIKNSETLATIGSAISQKFGNIKEDLAQIWDGIKSSAEAKWELIKTGILAPVLLLIDLVTGDFDQLKEDAENIWNKIKESAEQMWTGIKDSILGIVDLLWGDIIEGIKQLATDIPQKWEEIKADAIAKWEEIKAQVIEKVQNLREEIPKKWEEIKADAIEKWETIKTEVINKVQELWNNAKEKIQSLKEELPQLWEDIKSEAVQKWEDIKTKVTETAQNMIEGVKEFIADIPKTIEEKVGEAVAFLKDLPDQALQWGKDLIKNFIDGIKKKWDDLKDGMSETAENIRGYIHFSEPDVGPLSDFHTYAPDMMDLFIKGIRDNTKALQAQVAKSFDFENLITAPTADASGAGKSAGGSNITMNIYGAVGQDVNELADIISYRLRHQIDQNGAVYA